MYVSLGLRGNNRVKILELNITEVVSDKELPSIFEDNQCTLTIAPLKLIPNFNREKRK